MTNIVANGNAYSDDGSSSRDMQGGGFRQWLLPMLGDTIVQTAGDAGAAANAKDIAASAAQAAGDSAAAASDFADLAQAAFAQADAIGSGWSPQVQLVPYGVRVVMQVTDWVGGKGPKPGIGYVGPAGLVAAIADGTNLRGAVAYSDLTDKPTLGTAAALDVPGVAAAAATAAQVVRGDDPRLVGALNRGTQLYTTSQSIPKSTFGTATYVLVELWGGGASGGAVVSTTSGTADRAGGEGGEYVQVLLRVASLAASESLVIGSGGVAVVNSTGSLLGGNQGGDTSFAGVVALGGLASATREGPSKSFLAGKTGGDGGGIAPNALLPSNRLSSGPGGSSVNGGGGGGGCAAGYQDAGASQFAGNGGAGLLTTVSPAVAESGAIPSGGGGGVRLNLATGTATSGAGARGQARMTWW